ncbi:Hpt domain-containing protein [Devosia sp. J2-20]|jgi:HPt (histidine-containing phosphotransfer) domain-containing protein|uniref:Hpt domain-containing protein n=1 Tax=Devosia TaxID=46913 RepID=UPI0022B0287F|nr:MULTISPECIES: Hpt domain-containing protein [Devosia]MCZ4345847.1 Hpt domain-containing protein [Devosia neptuniae]WDQ99020.1 Hpt domain-containing protein [Devosia sp. J2-20]|tara:strand:- start:17357 stop:17749 length:393 start_codon:yes stop_codon:yes gene_type:complete
MVQRAATAEHLSFVPVDRAGRPIDLVHLAKQCLGDAHLECEILRMYDATVKTYFSRLKLASSFDELAMNLHSIKGASGGVGAFSVADLAKAAEVELQAGRPLSSERVDDLGMAIEEVSGFIARMLDNEPA